MTILAFSVCVVCVCVELSGVVGDIGLDAAPGEQSFGVSGGVMSSTSLKLVSHIGLNRGALDHGPVGVVGVNNTSVTVYGISGESNSSDELTGCSSSLVPQ